MGVAFSYRKRPKNNNNPQNPQNGQKGPPGASQITKNHDSDIQESRKSIASWSLFALLFSALIDNMSSKSVENRNAKLAVRKEMARWRAMRAAHWIDFQSEWVENCLELMAKDIRTQPTSWNSIPTSQNLDFGTCVFVLVVFVTCFGTHNRVSPLIPEKCLTREGYIDAD